MDQIPLAVRYLQNLVSDKINDAMFYTSLGGVIGLIGTELEYEIGSSGATNGVLLGAVTGNFIYHLFKEYSASAAKEIKTQIENIWSEV